MLTVLLTAVELEYPLPAGCFVLPLLPQAATANELNATRMMPFVALKDVIRDICCSCN
jgi:hypothetical protein